MNLCAFGGTSPISIRPLRAVMVGIWWVIGLLPLQAQNATAQEMPVHEAADTSTLVPSLGQHTFVLHSDFPDAFISSRIRNSIGVGTTSILSIPPFDINGEEVEILLGKLLYAELEFEYQHIVKEWLAVWFRIDMASRLGTETSTLLSHGVTVLTSFEIGWKTRLWHNEKMMLTGTAAVVNLNYTMVDMLGFVQRVLQNGGLDSSNVLVHTGPLTAAAIGARYAYGINDLFGLSASFDVSYGESVQRGKSDEWYYKAGAMLDMNLVGRTDVPLGLAVGYELSTFPGPNPNAKGNTHAILFRIAHTRSEDFSVGLDMAYNSTPVSTLSDRLDYASASLSLVIYF